MIDWKNAALLTGSALLFCGFCMGLGFMVTMTSGAVWWAVPAAVVAGAALVGGSGEL